MRAAPESSGRERRKSAWWRLAGWALGIAAVAVGGAAFLFTGSEVSCREVAEADNLGLRCGFVVAAPVEAVWEAFTRTGEPRPYYFDAVLEAEVSPGGSWRFVTDDRQRLLAGGEVLAIEPPHRFEQTFVAADLADPPSRVAVELEEVDGGCSVSLVHDRFPGKTATYRRFRRAHPLALSALKSWLEAGELPLRARLYTAIFKPGMKLFTVRAESWPAAGRDSGGER